MIHRFVLPSSLCDLLANTITHTTSTKLKPHIDEWMKANVKDTYRLELTTTKTTVSDHEDTIIYRGVDTRTSYIVFDDIRDATLFKTFWL